MPTTKAVQPLRISFYTRGTEFNGNTIKNKGRIGIYNIDIKQMHGLGTPDDLNEYMARNI